MKAKLLIVALGFLMFLSLNGFAAGQKVQEAGKAAEMPKSAKLRLLTDETNTASQKWLNGAIARFEADNPGITVEATFMKWSALDQKLQTEIAAGSPSDVFNAGAEDMWSMVRRGLLEPVTDLIEETGGKDDYWKYLTYSPDDEMYWVPYATSTDLMWWRTDLLKEGGLFFPALWEDFITAISKLTVDRNGDGVIDVYGHITTFSDSNAGFTHMMQAAWSNEGYMFDADNNLILDKSPYRERFIEALENRKERAKYCPPGVATYQYKDFLQGFYSGKVASAIYGPRLLSQVHQYGPELAPVTEGYTIPYGRKIHQMTFSDGWSIPKGVKYPALAKKFVKSLVSGPEYLEFLHTVPLHLAPPKKTVAYSAEYLDNEIIKAHPKTTKLYYNMLEIAKSKTGPWGGPPNPVLVELYTIKELQGYIARYVVGGESADSVVDDLIKRLKELHAEVMK